MATVKQCDMCGELQKYHKRFKWVKWSNWCYHREFCSNKCLFQYVMKYSPDEKE